MEYSVNNIDEFLSCIKKIKNQENDSLLWFRGHNRSYYNLQPSLVRYAIQVTNFINPFVGLYNLVTMKMKNVKTSFSLSDSQYISKASLLYIINNEAATEALTITLHPYAYSRLAEDADVVAALANHPLISLASA